MFLPDAGCGGEGMSDVLDELAATIAARKGNPPPGSYTAQLLASGLTAIVKKVGEEAIEVIVAAEGETQERVVYESADLIYHLMVLLAARDIEWRQVEAELARRRPAASE